MHLPKKAFTLIELVVVVTMIGILIMATTVYLGGADEKRKIIEAQGCASTIHGELNNFVFYALTSKNLKIDGHETNPEQYRIGIGSGDCIENHLEGCNYISLVIPNFKTESQSLFKELKTSNTCHKKGINIRFIGQSNKTNNNSMTRIKINKGLSTSTGTNNPFIIDHDNGDTTLTGEIIILLCLNSNCDNHKEISKWFIDGRSQTISLINCKYYNEEDPSKCELRDGEEPKLKEKTDDTENNG